MSGDRMTFPTDWRDFLNGHSFKDKEKVYTNGSELVQTYRVKQMVEHYFERTCRIVEGSRKYVLSDGTELFEDGCSECNGYLEEGDNYCPSCGAKVVE